MVKQSRQRKGQSAIEYLMTYGWMLLVIAIVGGAIFTTVQGQTQAQTTSGLANADVQIENWGITGAASDNQNLTMELRNAAQEQVEIKNVTVTFPNGSEAYPDSTSDTIATIPVGDTATLNFDKVIGDDTQDDVGVSINYDTGIPDLVVNGTITGNLGYGSSS
jgi:hypothetical protein